MSMWHRGQGGHFKYISGTRFEQERQKRDQDWLTSNYT